MNFKRKSKVASRSSKCGICCGQRRHFGESELQRKKEKALKVIAE